MYTSFFTILLSFFLQKDTGVTTQNNGIVEIHFTNFAGAKILSPDSLYTNTFNESYSIGRLKYYITNMELVNTESGKSASIANSYFLVDEGNDASKTISLSVPEGSYNAISFLLGVDSLHNVSGAQTGALDPMNGMFWTWNTGYVSIKIEGKSLASTLPGKFYEYHLGGFKGPDKVNNSIRLTFPEGIIDITEKKPIRVYVKTDVNLFFSSVNPLPIKTNPACTAPGSLARQYSENYATIFSISKVDYK